MGLVYDFMVCLRDVINPVVDHSVVYHSILYYTLTYCLRMWRACST